MRGQGQDRLRAGRLSRAVSLGSARLRSTTSRAATQVRSTGAGSTVTHAGPVVADTGTADDPDRTGFTLSEMQARGRAQVGRHTYGNPVVRCYPGDTGTVSIGGFCSIADAVEIFLGGEHRTDFVSTFPFRARWELPGALEDGMPFSRGDVQIGNDVWLGRGARLMSGVSIGDGAVVGAYSVLATDVRPYAVVAGSPARERRRRFTEQTVEALLEASWWTWPDSELLALVDVLSSGRVEELLAHARQRQLGG